MPYMGLAPDLYQTIVAKTANYQLLVGDIGKMFTNKGASGSVTFTLPDAGAAGAGWWCEFFVVADQAIVVASTPADKMVTKNEADADSFSFAQAGELIGSACKVVSDGALWYVLVMAEEAVTVAIVD